VSVGGVVLPQPFTTPPNVTGEVVVVIGATGPDAGGVIVAAKVLDRQSGSPNASSPTLLSLCGTTG